MGLARALSKLGFCSRSRAFVLVREGRVGLNGSTARNPGARVRLGTDRISVDGSPVVPRAALYWMLNKPRGLVSTTRDELGRETVYARLPAGLPWMGPVGRLDRASEGLLLFTNDPEWADKLTSPASHLEKTYHVRIRALAGAELLGALEKGVRARDGSVLAVKRARKIREGRKNSWVEIVLEEGKNRHIRRMFEARGLEVLSLVRVAVGPLLLGDLAKGRARELTAEEKSAIDCALDRSTIQRRTPAVTGKYQ